ncbi:membrane protein insertase YidC [Aristaeella hokkaidonensis]|nr:membrane protein insertase YidC [Aristaeella hokkaidonensis]
MGLCYSLVQNYGLAIILFTILSKVVLLPVSLWTHRNGLKVVKMQPEINRLKVEYYGDKDTIAEKQAELYKRVKYNPLASLLPLAIQIIILMGVIEVIYHPLTYLLHMDTECVNAYLSAAKDLFGVDPSSNPAQLRLLGLIMQGNGATLASAVPDVWKASLSTLESFDLHFLGVNLTWIASEMSLVYLLIPVAAGASSLILALAQNRLNPLQREQNTGTQWGTLAFSVGLSLYLGYFVPAGVALYWVAGNLLAIVLQIVLNHLIDPRKVVDYKALEESRKELDELQNLGKDQDPKEAKILRKREKEDYKRFFSVVNKHLVFYSESNGFYKYFKGYIEYILKNTTLTIHYVTSDPKDQIFEMEKTQPQIRAYYIGENKLITLMMKMDADVVCMTMPDLQNFHIKRSYIRDDIEYIFIQHGVGSNNMGMRRGCTDHFDTVFCCGPHQKAEEEQISELYQLKKRELVEVGYPLIDQMREAYQEEEHNPGNPPRILIAPSWQKDNIVDSCLESLLDELKKTDYQIIVRPHPQEVRLKKQYMDMLKTKYEADGIEIQTDFSSNNPLLTADILITDWSGISWEYAFTTLKPILFINTPMKVMNPEYQKIQEVPLNIQLRDKLGKNLNTDEIEKAGETIDYLLKHKDEYKIQIDKLAHTYLYNMGHAAETGGAYIVSTIIKKIEEKGGTER